MKSNNYDVLIVTFNGNVDYCGTSSGCEDSFESCDNLDFTLDPVWLNL